MYFLLIFYNFVITKRRRSLNAVYSKFKYTRRSEKRSCFFSSSPPPPPPLEYASIRRWIVAAIGTLNDWCMNSGNNEISLFLLNDFARNNSALRDIFSERFYYNTLVYYFSTVKRVCEVCAPKLFIIVGVAFCTEWGRRMQGGNFPFKFKVKFDKIMKLCRV